MFNHLKNKFNKYLLPREYLFRILVVFLTFVSFFMLDFLTKHFLFTFDKTKQGIGISYGIIGIRSFPHANTTLISFLKLNFNPLFLGLFGLFLASLLLISTIFIKRKLLVFWLMIIMAGIIGNALDFLRFKYVLDIIYLPWYDRGTFNFADVMIIFGSIGLLITIFVTELVRNKNSKDII